VVPLLPSLDTAFTVCSTYHTAVFHGRGGDWRTCSVCGRVPVRSAVCLRPFGRTPLIAFCLHGVTGVGSLLTFLSLTFGFGSLRDVCPIVGHSDHLPSGSSIPNDTTDALRARSSHAIIFTLTRVAARLYLRRAYCHHAARRGYRRHAATGQNAGCLLLAKDAGCSLPRWCDHQLLTRLFFGCLRLQLPRRGRTWQHCVDGIAFSAGAARLLPAVGAFSPCGACSRVWWVLAAVLPGYYMDDILARDVGLAASRVDSPAGFGFGDFMPLLANTSAYLASHSAGLSSCCAFAGNGWTDTVGGRERLKRRLDERLKTTTRRRWRLAACGFARRVCGDRTRTFLLAVCFVTLTGAARRACLAALTLHFALVISCACAAFLLSPCLSFSLSSLRYWTAPWHFSRPSLLLLFRSSPSIQAFLPASRRLSGYLAAASRRLAPRLPPPVSLSLWRMGWRRTNLLCGLGVRGFARDG